MSQVATGPTDAVYQVKAFLEANGISGDTITEAIDEYAVQQWCSPEPYRCGARRSHAPPHLPWATPLWEACNKALEAPDKDPMKLIAGMVDELTGRIESLDGCLKCARRWNAWITLNPIEGTTLNDARRFLWNAHNHTREGRPPVPYFEIAQKFNWT